MQQPGSLGCLLTLLCALLLGIEQEGVGPRAPEHHQLQSQPILPCPGELPQNTSSAHQSARTVLDTSTPPWEKISRAQYRPTSNFQVIHVSRSLRLNVQHHFHSISSCWDQFKVWYPNFQVIGASVWQLLYVYWKINLFSVIQVKIYWDEYSSEFPWSWSSGMGFETNMLWIKLSAHCSIFHSLQENSLQLKGSREVSKQLSQQCQSSHLMTSPRLTTVPKLLCPIALVQRSQLNFLLFWD